ncbi:MAG: hypothetical protein WKF63_03480 [Thermomicrobiales bacterium]
MTIITFAALVITLVAGWGIGQLAGGGSGDSPPVVQAIPTLEPTATLEPTTAPTAPTRATPATPGEEATPGVRAEPTNAPSTQLPTSVPDSP